ncbi:MAG: hypothetical protein FWD39_01165 [Clostridiales bacterium]|nr:hypothetical protein [Clostridiales bacterium]
MDILITCAMYLLFAVCLTHIILEAMGRKARKKRGCLAVYMDYMGVGFWVVGLLSNILITYAYYRQIPLMRYGPVTLNVFFAFSALYLLLLTMAYYQARWKVVIDGKKIIKCGLLCKKTYNISDITKIEHIEFASKFYIGDKKIFTQDKNSHTGDFAAVLRYIKENSDCQEVKKSLK